MDELARIEVLGADGRVETIEGTTVHPIWSLDRHDWIPLGELAEGEQLLGSTGPALILTHAILHRSLPVYDIEVHGEHVYEVGELGLLVHNACPASWNQFQSATVGQFASRAEAEAAWNAYRQANGIVTGTVRSSAARSNFLKGLAEDPKTPSWIKQWLSQGKTPPGYDVDHILPLSVGGLGDAVNMRLQLRELHKLHHRFYRPWE